MSCIDSVLLILIKCSFTPSSQQKWGKKGRKLRNKDPYNCHPDLDNAVVGSTVSSGAVTNAGKYGSSGYTRASYAGAKAATPFEGSANRPVKSNK